MVLLLIGWRSDLFHVDGSILPPVIIFVNAFRFVLRQQVLGASEDASHLPAWTHRKLTVLNTPWHAEIKAWYVQVRRRLCPNA